MEPVNNNEEEWEDKDSNESSEEEKDVAKNPNAPVIIDEQKGDLGCKHYKRACMKQCSNPICEGKYWNCRLCHDEVCYEQEMNPKKNH